MLHPYYKLAYIKIAWGGPEEQAKEIAAGSPYAKDWRDEAKKIVERTVSSNSIPVELVANEMIHILHRWRSTIETAHVSLMELADVANAPVLSDFDKHREHLLTDDAQEGWASELRRYVS